MRTSEPRGVGNDPITQLETKYREDPPRHARALAEAYLADGRASEALHVLEKHANGKDVDQAVLLAQAWFDTFDNARSARTLKKAAKVGSLDQHVHAQLLLGQLAFEAGKPEEARGHLHKVRSLDPTNRRAAQLLRNLGERVDLPPGEDRFPVRHRPEMKETARTAMRQILIAAAVGAVVVGAYAWWMHRIHEARVLSVEAARLVANADVTSLRAAEAKYLEALDLHGSEEHAIAGIAETYALLWVDHGLASEKDKAREYASRAADAEIDQAQRYAAEMLVAFGEGRYPDVEKQAAFVIDEEQALSERLFWVRGMAQRAMGNVKIGRDNMRRAAELRNDHPLYARWLGDAYEEDHDPRNSAFYWAQAAGRNMNDPIGVSRNIIARVRRGESATVLAADLDRLEAVPAEGLGGRDRAALALARSELALRMGDTNAALAAADKAVTEGGEVALNLLARGWANLAAGKTDAGVADLKLAHDKSPALLGTLEALVLAYEQTGKFDEAVKLVEPMVAQTAQEPRFYIMLGNVYLAKGDFAKAQAQLDKAAQIEPEYAELLLARGVMAWKQRKFDEAAKILEKAVAGRAVFPEVYETVGLMWIDEGALTQAAPQLEKAERDFKAMATEVPRMNRFFHDVIAAFTRARGGSSFAAKWTQAQQAYGKGS